MTRWFYSRILQRILDYTANITLKLKPGKDHTRPLSDYPISLINANLKIISKALVRRPEKTTSLIMHPDQTVFMNGKHSYTNTCRLINLIDYSTINNLETTIVSLDADK